ncbi:hypothetical protein F5Y10DRAFT_195737 [Nemania abortiva]|nr:hypothetical protein F5Y10DRAFT_195737 [Nemania abortiva]
MIMLPSTSSSSTSTNGPAPASACAPVPGTTDASTGSSLILPQRASAGTSTGTATKTPTATTAATGSSTATPGLAHPSIDAPKPEAISLLGNDPSHYKRGPSPSPDGQSPDSSGSLTGGRDNVSALLHDHRTKKRRTGPGSRGVANLTPEQLAKKRANDREAQRAIRERTKNQIEALENRIRELTEQQPYQELQKVIREKEAAEAHNAELRAHLTSIMTSIQALLSGNTGAFTSLAATFNPTQPAQQQQQQQLLPYSVHNSLTPGNESTSDSGVDLPWRSPALLQSTSPPNLGSQEIDLSIQKRQDYISNLNVNNEYSKVDFLVDPSQHLDRMQTSANAAQGSLPAYPSQPVPMKYEWNASTHLKHDNGAATNNAFPLSPLPSLIQYISYIPSPSHSPQGSYVHFEGPIKHIPPTGPVDTLLLGLMQERRQRVARGESTLDVMGPEEPSIYYLLNPDLDIPSHDKGFLTKVSADIMSKFSALDQLPERVAVLYVVYHLMRWQINPTQENFDQLPPFSIPVGIQYSKPHPPWMDYIPFPKMREYFVHNYDVPGYDFNTMFLPYTQTLSVNWHYDVLNGSPEDRDVSINPDFRKHLLDINNWTLGDEFDQAYPNLRGTYNFRSRLRRSQTYE